MTAIGEKPRSLQPGSLRLDGFVIDWSQRTARGLVARTSYLHPHDLMTTVLDTARGSDRPTPPTTDAQEATDD